MSQIIKTPAIKRKCGDITAGLFEDNNEFYLNCDFCECTYLQLNTFIQHIYDDHLAQLGLLKQETTTTPLYSHDPFDCYDLKSATEENLINDQEMEAVLKESSDTHFVSNDFETVLLHPTVVEIKEEYQEGVKNLVDVHTGIKDVHNAIDFTNDDDKMTPGSEIPHKEKKSRTKKKKAKNLGRRVKVVDADARSLRKKKKSRKKTTQTPVDVRDPVETKTVGITAFNEAQQTDQKAIHNANDVTNDDEMMSDQNDIHNANDVTNDDEMVSHQNDIHDANDVTNDDDEVLLESLQKTKKARRKRRQNDSKPQAKKISISHSVIDVSKRIILAEIYKKHTCLWNEKKDIRYHFNNRRAEAMVSAREEFNNKTGLSFTENDFLREVLCLRKMCSNEKKNKIACRQENKEYKPSIASYNCMEYLEVDVFPFVCVICEDQHRTLGKLKEHEASHDGSLPFKCYECGRGFQVANYLTQHLRRHAQDLPFSCKVCNKPFITATEVVIHMRTHTDERPFVCYMCGIRVKTSSALIEHITRHEDDRRFKCEICSKGFFTPAMRRMHRKIHKKERDFICEICQKAYKTSHDLKQHLLIHNSVKSYVCKICEKRFAQCTGLYSHMKSHGATSTKSSSLETSTTETTNTAIN